MPPCIQPASGVPDHPITYPAQLVCPALLTGKESGQGHADRHCGRDQRLHHPVHVGAALPVCIYACSMPPVPLLSRADSLLCRLHGAASCASSSA